MDFRSAARILENSIDNLAAGEVREALEGLFEALATPDQARDYARQRAAALAATGKLKDKRPLAGIPAMGTGVKPHPKFDKYSDKVGEELEDEEDESDDLAGPGL